MDLAYIDHDQIKVAGGLAMIKSTWIIALLLPLLIVLFGSWLVQLGVLYFKEEILHSAR